MTVSQEQRVSRAEWIATAAFGLNVLGLVFGGGALWNSVQEHDRRLEALEASNGALIQKVERIDANVQFLAELAREERVRQGR